MATGYNTQYNATHAAIVTLLPTATPPSHQEKLPTFSSVTAATGDIYSQQQQGTWHRPLARTIIYIHQHTHLYTHICPSTLWQGQHGVQLWRRDMKCCRREAASVCAALHVSTPGMYVAMWALSGFPEECALVVRCVKKTNFREQKAGCNWSPNLPRCH